MHPAESHVTSVTLSICAVCWMFFWVISNFVKNGIAAVFIYMESFLCGKKSKIQNLPKGSGASGHHENSAHLYSLPLTIYEHIAASCLCLQWYSVFFTFFWFHLAVEFQLTLITALSVLPQAYLKLKKYKRHAMKLLTLSKNTFRVMASCNLAGMPFVFDCCCTNFTPFQPDFAVHLNCYGVNIFPLFLLCSRDKRLEQCICFA